MYDMVKLFHKFFIFCKGVIFQQKMDSYVFVMCFLMFFSIVLKLQYDINILNEKLKYEKLDRMTFERIAWNWRSEYHDKYETTLRRCDKAEGKISQAVDLIERYMGYINDLTSLEKKARSSNNNNSGTKTS